jgi:hypothetical protein
MRGGENGIIENSELLVNMILLFFAKVKKKGVVQLLHLHFLLN